MKKSKMESLCDVYFTIPLQKLLEIKLVSFEILFKKMLVKVVPKIMNLRSTF